MIDKKYIELRLDHLSVCSNSIGSKKHKGWLRDAIRIAKEATARADGLQEQVDRVRVVLHDKTLGGDWAALYVAVDDVINDAPEGQDANDLRQCECESCNDNKLGF